MRVRNGPVVLELREGERKVEEWTRRSMVKSYAEILKVKFYCFVLGYIKISLVSKMALPKKKKKAK